MSTQTATAATTTPKPPADHARPVHFRIWRGDKNNGAFVEYTVNVTEGMVLLDCVHRIQAEQASDLACRWNCKAGKCGSCSAEINGKPSLMCMTRMDTLPPDKVVTVEPMRSFPLIATWSRTSVGTSASRRPSSHSSRASLTTPTDPGPCSSKTSTAYKSSASALSASCARMSATSSVTTTRKTNSSGRAS